MSYPNIDFVYLNEEDMIRAGVLDAAKCIETMRDTMALFGKKDFLAIGFCLALVVAAFLCNVANSGRFYNPFR